MELKLYKNAYEEYLAVMFYNEEHIVFSFERGVEPAVSYKVENSDIDFVLKRYLTVQWDNKYGEEVIKAFFKNYKDYIEWL